MSIRITGMNSGLDTDSMVKELVNAYEKQGEKYTKARTKTEWKQEAWKTLNSKIKSFYSKYASNMRFSDAYNKKSTTVSDSSKASIIAGNNAIKGTQTLEINKLASAGYMTGGQLDSGVTGTTKISSLVSIGEEETVKIKISRGKGDPLEVSVNKDTTVEELTAKINAISDMSANYDSGNGRIYIGSNNMGTENDFNFDDNTGKASDILKKLKLTSEDGAVKKAASNAEIVLNDVTYTSSSNTFSVNGLTITAKEKTEAGSKLSIVTDSDVDGIYDSIKGFVKEYNSLINELDKLYNAKSASKYEPLTDDEKDAMTDTEIEKWEQTIKDSLLRRDSDVSSISNAMRNSMLKAYEVKVGGQSIGTFSLSSFGIGTAGYFDTADNEKNALHIDGDSDDEFTSANSDKLKAMIASNPDAVQGFFSQLIEGLYDEMNKIQGTSDNYTSYGSFYSDKKLQSDYDDQDKQVSKWEDYVADIEEKYYKQFTAMETSLSKIQSQESSLSQLFSS